ncbi:MAG: hypothetical protein JWN39_314 [Ilumatobacteraceae bacterium]|nr:hypothetical protein [Ilumatobacteraceae bacterium]
MRRGTDRRTPEHADRGAALLLAIGFVVMIGAITAGLASLVTSGVQNQVTLIAVRDRQYAADGAIETAVAHVRAAITSAGSGCTSVAASTVVHLNGLDVHVDWRDACGVTRTDDGLVVAQRGVAFDSCIDTGAPCVDANVIIRALVDFDQDASGAVTHTAVQSWSVVQ